MSLLIEDEGQPVDSLFVNQKGRPHSHARPGGFDADTLGSLGERESTALLSPGVSKASVSAASSP